MRTILASLLFSSLALAADDALPKAETILDHYVEVTGGKAAYAKLHNSVSHGKFSLPAQGIEGKVALIAAEPNKDLASIEIENLGKIESGTNGEVAWEKNPLQGPRIKDGEERAEAIRDATYNSPSAWRKLYTKVETTGSETVEGQDCYKVVLTPTVGKPSTQYFDKKTGYMLKSIASRNTAMGEVYAEVFPADYRKDGAVISPHKITNRVAGQEFVITLDTVEYNVDLPKNTFDLPDEIQALVKKAAAPAAAAPAKTTAPSGADSGKLTLYMGGKPLASETYSLERGDGKVSLTGSGTATLGGTMKIDIEIFKVVMDETYHPQLAEARAKMGTIPMAIKTTFASGKAVNEANNGQSVKTKEDSVHGDPIVVNNNLPFYPWSVLTARTRFDTKEPQEFPVYVLNQSEVMGTVLYTGKETVEFAGGKTAELHHINAKGMLGQTPIVIDFWVDDNHKIIKMVVPSQSVEAYQDGFDRKP